MFFPVEIDQSHSWIRDGERSELSMESPELHLVAGIEEFATIANAIERPVSES